MYLVDQVMFQELWLKGLFSGKNYIGLVGLMFGEQDCEIVFFDGWVLIICFIDKDVVICYGNMVYVCCVLKV